jgi:hypothetical protein
MFQRRDDKKRAGRAVPENIVFTSIEQHSYDAAWTLLNEPSTQFFAPFPSLVNTDEVIFPSAKKKKRNSKQLAATATATTNYTNSVSNNYDDGNPSSSAIQLGP